MKGTLIHEDPYLAPYRHQLKDRVSRLKHWKKELAGKGSLEDFALGYLYYGLHRTESGWILREWLPQATEVFLLFNGSDWLCRDEWRLQREDGKDDWILNIPYEAMAEGDHFKLLVRWQGGEGIRFPAYCFRTHQDGYSYDFTARAYEPGKYEWEIPDFKPKKPLTIYETHIGMAPEEGKVGSFEEFRLNTLPRIADAGYNTIQIMALMEHPYYGSFGYQVSSFFALSSRFGPPEDFKRLVDDCHSRGIGVIMDLVHSHAVKNQVEGISHQDGTEYSYFHSGGRGNHPAWDSRCFNYGKHQVLHFLLSNCAWWLKEYNLDGFRFDGVTSMLYHDHGLGASFDHYEKYFNGNVDLDSITYLSLANDLIHEIKPHAITIAEDMSGMPGMARSTDMGGLGFDYRLTMGIPDYWIKILKEKQDQDWNVDEIWDCLNNRRFSENHITYAESHDQALVGDKTIAFRLMDAEMYTHMSRHGESLIIDRGMALHKMLRLLTFSLGGDGYMNFMGNEFGHPEWIDFPREGNGWSYHYARRQWSLRENEELRYGQLADFDREMVVKCLDSLEDRYAKKVLSHVSDQVICYTRGSLLFIFNLSPDRSYTDYAVYPGKGSYRLILSSDDHAFGGWERIPKDMSFEIRKKSESVPLYLPARTAQVFINDESTEHR
ncbi:MAG: alpha amylase C-terminal domain-containing protein [Spirochaetales bacterium]|nr:alpha amylase C-terminal domain-containing protein [Spirochaetales bacterium]